MNKDTPQSDGFSKSSPMPDSYSSGYTPQSNTDWREKFKKICDYSGIGMCPGCGLTPEALDTLISQLLEAEKKRLREEVEKMMLPICQHGPSDSCDTDCYHQEGNESYNQALDAVLQKLS